MFRFTSGRTASALPALMTAGMVLVAPAAAAQESGSATQCRDVAAPAGSVAGACVEHAINTKGTGTSGRSSGGGDCDDSDCDAGPDAAASTAKDAAKVVKPKCVIVNASQNTQSLRQAVDTKGTGASSGKAAGPGGADAGASGGATAGKYSAPINGTRTCPVE